MQKRIWPLILIIFLVIKSQNISGQKYVKDSVVLRFGTQQIEPIPIYIDTIVDNRDELIGTQVRISEKTRYLFIPVDRYYTTEKTLNQNIQNLFSSEKHDTAYKIVVDEFEINHRSGLINGTTLSAKLKIYEGVAGQPKLFKGTLLYLVTGPKPRNKELTENYEHLLNDWKNNFTIDIPKVKQDTVHQHSFDFFNYRPGLEKIPTMLYLSSVAIVGLDWWMVDAELGFYDPEVTQQTILQTNFFRYRWTKQFESMAIGKDAIHFCYRLNHSLIVEAVPQMSIGFNRWKDWDTNPHDFYDIFILNGSIRENIQFNPLDKKSILFTVGLIQDAYYIHSLDWKIKPGLIVGFGFKF